MCNVKFARRKGFGSRKYVCLFGAVFLRGIDRVFTLGHLSLRV